MAVQWCPKGKPPDSLLLFWVPATLTASTSLLSIKDALTCTHTKQHRYVGYKVNKQVTQTVKHILKTDSKEEKQS